MKVWVKYSLWTLLYLFLSAALVGYFFYAGKLRDEGKKLEVCKNIRVTLLDSSLNRFVTKTEVIDLIEQFNHSQTIGKSIDSLQLHNLEKLLESRSAIEKSQISVNREGIMNIDILQRVPVIRIETLNGGFYIDRTGYIFPLIENSSTYIPIVTGELPINITQERKLIGKDSVMWVKKLIDLGSFLMDNPFWNAQIEQIYFASPNVVEMYARVGEEKIIFGDLNYIEKKFKKLYAYYTNATPTLGWDKYSSINLSFKNQVVCKKKK